MPSRTHDLWVLFDQMDKANIDIPKWIIDNADLFRDYATKSRYGTDILASRRKMKELISYIGALVNDLKPSESFGKTPSDVFGKR